MKKLLPGWYICPADGASVGFNDRKAKRHHPEGHKGAKKPEGHKLRRKLSELVDKI